MYINIVQYKIHVGKMQFKYKENAVDTCIRICTVHTIIIFIFLIFVYR